MLENVEFDADTRELDLDIALHREHPGAIPIHFIAVTCPAARAGIPRTS
ncbi:MAG: hypothetical protein R2708_23125 [Vicinamibacterales bacterium]